MSSLPIKVGFIGLSTTGGWASLTLAPSLLHPSLKDKFKLVAISNSTAESSSKAVEKYDSNNINEIRAYHGSSTNISSDEEVELVVISVMVLKHLELALPVVEAGKDVFVEWPVGKSIEETLMIQEAVKRKGVRCVVNLQARNSLAMKKVKSLIESGAIGQVKSTTFQAVGIRELGQWSPYTGARQKYTVDKANGTTALIVGIGHQLDALMHILGSFTSITASAAQLYPTSTVIDSAGNPTDEVLTANAPDQFSFSGILTSGAHATVTWRGGCRKVPGRKVLQWEIEGEEGMIRLESSEAPWMQLKNPEVYLNGEKVDIGSVEGCSEMVGTQLQSWEEYTKGPDVGTYATIEDAVKLKRVLEAVEASASQGRRIEL